MDEKEFQKVLLEQFKEMRSDISDMRSDINQINERLAGVEENTEITRSATNSLVEWAEVTGGFPIKKAE